MIYYQGSEGHIKVLGDNELQHFKYIKKIGNRYFYTPEALRAYYEDQKKVAAGEYAKDRTIDKGNQLKREATIRKDYVSGKDTRKQYERNKKINKAIYDAQGKYRSAKRTVKPIAKTAKRSVTPVKTPKERAMEFLNKNGSSTTSQVRKKKKKKNNSEAAKAYERYKKSQSTQKRVSDYQSRVRGG